MSKYFSSIKYHFHLSEYVHGDSDYWESDSEELKSKNLTVQVTQKQDHQEKEECFSGDDEESAQGHAKNSTIQKRNEFLSKYLDISSDENSDREGGASRVVKSQRQKRAQEFEDLLQSARDNFEATAWPKAQADLDKLSKMLFKYFNASDREEIGDLLDLLEEFDTSLKGILAENEKEDSTTSTKAFNALRQQTKKILREINQQYGHLFQEQETIETSTPTTAIVAAAEKSSKLDSNQILERVDEILQLRGKKGTEPTSLISSLKEMLSQAEGHVQVRIFVAILAISFEYNRNALSCLPLRAWKESFEHLKLLVYKLHQNISSIRLQEKGQSSSETEEKIHLVKGNLTSLLVMLDDEFLKSFLFCNPFSEEYSERMQLEEQLLALLQQARDYFTTISIGDSVELLAFRLMEHIYWRNGQLERLTELNDSIKRPISKTKRELFIFYSLSIHGKHEEASKVYHQLIEQRQEQQQQQQQRMTDLDYHQTLFHRCIVQFGLLNFSLGNFKEATELLMLIFNSSIKPKELIGQSFRQSVSHFTSTSYADKSAEERQERQRQVPFHMHINLDSVEIVYFLLSFLVEAPIITDLKKKTQGRGLKKAYEAMEKSTFSVPPTSAKESILVAVSHFVQANWNLLKEELSQLKIWSTFPQATLKSYLEELQYLFIRCYFQENALYYKSFCLNKIMKEMGIDENNTEFIQTLSDELSASKSQRSKNAETAESKIETENIVPFSQCITQSA
jgi:translation initiation factor 3 subunit C